MASFSLNHNIRQISGFVRGIPKQLNTAAHRAIEKEAIHTRRNLALKTPKKWSGRTRKAWTVVNKGRITPNFIHFRVENLNPVMRFLEKGTKVRRPRTAPHLFIPLKKSAWRKGGYQRGMVFGRDFVFARKAKGIKAIRIIPAQKKKTRQRLRTKLGRVAKSIRVSG